MYSLLILYAVIAIGFSFLCSMAEATLLSVTPSYIATLRNRKARLARRLQLLKDNIDRPLAAILSLNTIAHTAGAAGVGAEAARLWDQGVAWASAVMTLLILVLSEIIPKTIGALYWRQLAPWMASVVQALIWLLYPLVVLSEMMTKLLSGGQKQEIVTREEVAAMAALSAEGGGLELKESRILKNLFLLRSLTVQHIMTPRTVIRSFPESMTVGKALQQQPKLTVSRIPIYDGNIDHVTGFVLKSDVLLAQAEDKPQTQLKELRREMKAVPVTTSVSQLFDVLMHERQHVALVVDEYGGTSGLVTMEDLIETLLGLEIVDEADAAADMQHFARKKWERRAAALGLDISQLQQDESAAAGSRDNDESDER